MRFAEDRALDSAHPGLIAAIARSMIGAFFI